MKSRRTKKMIVKYAAWVGGIVLVVTASVSFLSYRIYNSKLIHERTKYESQLMENQVRLKKYEAASRSGWVLATDKKAGEVISESDVVSTLLPDYFTPENVVMDKEDVVGKVIKIDAEKSTAITDQMIYLDGQLEASERLEEVQYVRLPLKVQKNDTVDIRIVFPTGEDYIVVAKKKLMDVDVENQNAFFRDDEEEALLLQAALVDAYNNDAEIYMKQYVEPEMQPKPQVTYVPNENVIKAIKNNPQIVDTAKWKLADTIRKTLDDRLDKLDIDEKVRIGAGAPMGSAVAKRKKNDGAVYTESTTNPNQAGQTNNGTSVGVNGIVDQPATNPTPLQPANNAGTSSTTATNDNSTVYPEPNTNQSATPDANAQGEVPNLLGGNQ